MTTTAAQTAEAKAAAILIRELRQQFEREYRELVRELRARVLEPRSSMEEYRARRAAEMARWNQWSPAFEWAIAKDAP